MYVCVYVYVYVYVYVHIYTYMYIVQGVTLSNHIMILSSNCMSKSSTLCVSGYEGKL